MRPNCWQDRLEAIAQKIPGRTRQDTCLRMQPCNVRWHSKDSLAPTKFPKALRKQLLQLRRPKLNIDSADCAKHTHALNFNSSALCPALTTGGRVKDKSRFWVSKGRAQLSKMEQRTATPCRAA